MENSRFQWADGVDIVLEVGFEEVFEAEVPVVGIKGTKLEKIFFYFVEEGSVYGHSRTVKWRPTDTFEGFDVFGFWTVHGDGTLTQGDDVVLEEVFVIDYFEENF